MAGTVAQSVTRVSDNVRTVTFTCVGDVSGGAIPDTATSTANTAFIAGWYLYKITCNPGTTAPTADSDVYLKDADGVDLLGGNGVDLLHSSNSLDYTLGAAKEPVTGALTLDVDNQSVNSATYVITAVFVRA